MLSASAVRKQILKEGWPFVLSRIVGMGANYLIVFILAHHGSEQERTDNIAASSLINAGQLITASAAVSVLYSVVVISGRCKGADATEEIGGILQGGLILSALLSIPVVGSTVFSKPLYELLGQKPILASIAQNYFRGYAFGTPAYLAMNAWQQMLVSYGRPIDVLVSTVAYTSMVGIFGYLLANQTGSFGLGLGVSLANWATLLGLVAFSCTSPFKACNIFKRVSFQVMWSNIKKLSRVGFPIAFQILSELISFFMITLYASWLPNSRSNLAAKQAADSYLTIFVVASFGLGQTVASLISRQVGANQFGNARRFGIEGLKIGTGISIVVAGIFAFLNKQLASLLLPSHYRTANEFKLVRNLMFINGTGQLFDYGRNIGAAAARGYSLTKASFYISAISMTFLCLILGAIAAFALDWGMESIFASRALAMLMGAAGIIFYWNKKSKQAVSLGASPEETNLMKFFCGPCRDNGEERAVLISKNEIN